MMQIIWTEFQSAAADTKREVCQEWSELIATLEAAPVFESKTQCPWLKMARFGTTRSPGGSLRNNNNIIEITGVEGDYDGGVMQPEEAIALLERAGIKSCIYTSPSHTPQNPRWRVLAPLSTHKPITERTRMLARINGVLGGILSSESFTASQSYYYGRVKGHEYKVITTYGDPEEGEFVDLIDKLDEMACISRALPPEKANVPPSHAIAAAVEHLGRRLKTGDSRRELLRSYISDKSRRGLDVDEIMCLVEMMAERFFDPSDPIDRINIRKIATDFVQADYASGNSSSVFFGKTATGATIETTLPLLNLEQLKAANYSISWSVKHILPADSIGIMFGGSGTFKSFIALDLALHIAHGLPWVGRKTKRSAVIYIAAEGGAGLWKRIEAWHKSHKLPVEAIDFYVVPVSVDLIKDASNVVAAARSANVTPGLVIVDTMSQTFSGEENSANDVAAYLRELNVKFRAMWRSCVLVIHHSGHQATERPRGSSAIRANVDFMFGVFREENKMLARMECHKQKDGDAFKEMSFALDPINLGFDEDGDIIKSLVASYIASEEELQRRKQIEELRSDKNTYEIRALNLAQVGMFESAWRQAFYSVITGSAEAKRKAFQRVKARLVARGCISFGRDEVAEDNVLTFVGGTSDDELTGTF